MSLLLRGAAALALSALVAGGLAPAHADNLEAQGDELQGNDVVALGTLCVGDSSTTQTTFKLVRNGNEGPQVWDKSTTVAITPGANPSTARGVLTLGSTSASTPSDWLEAEQNATVTSGAASIAIAVPDAAPAGAGSATVTYTAIGTGASAASVDRTDTITFTWTVEDCATVDTTRPVISYVLDPAAPTGQNGWYTTDVSIDWTVTDPESAVAITGCEDTTFSTDGTFAPSCSATSAGGSAGPVTATVKRDTVGPVVTFAGGPADGSGYYFGDPIPLAQCEADDATSGVVGECTVSGGGTTVGSHTLTASASDAAGNIGTSQRTYTVLAWTLDGFYRPVVMGERVVNTVKAGSTVPLKFNVLKGQTPLTSDIGATFGVRKIACDTGDLQDPVEELAATGGTTLRYDAAGGQWIQNWATPAAGKGACYRVTMTTADGSSIAADFKLK